MQARATQTVTTALPRVTRSTLPQASGRVARRWLVVLVAALIGLSIYTWRPEATRLDYPEARTESGRYVAVPLGASNDARRKAAFLARKHRLPLVAEPGVTEVEIRSFSR